MMNPLPFLLREILLRLSLVLTAEVNIPNGMNSKLILCSISLIECMGLQWDYNETLRSIYLVPLSRSLARKGVLEYR
jgi:hypothetical protein